MPTIIFGRDNTVMSDDPHFAGQSWRRASYLVPVPCPKHWLVALHNWARPFRSGRLIWPLWVCYHADTYRYLGAWIGLDRYRLMIWELRLTLLNLIPPKETNRATDSADPSAA